MSDELDGLLRASVRAEAPDWLEQLVTERAVASVEGEASSFGAASMAAWSGRLRGAVAGFARGVRAQVQVRARMQVRRSLARVWARVRAAVPRVVLLGASASPKEE